MAKKMFQLKYLNISLWIVLILTYVMPNGTISGQQFKTYGFPLKFLTLYEPGTTIIGSSHMDLLGLAQNIVVFYFIVCIIFNIAGFFLHKKQ